MTGSHCIFHQGPEHLEDFGWHNVPLSVHICLVPLPQGLHEHLSLQPLLQPFGVPQRAGELGALQVVVSPALRPGPLVPCKAFQWDGDMEEARGQNLRSENKRRGAELTRWGRPSTEGCQPVQSGSSGGHATLSHVIRCIETAWRLLRSTVLFCH